MNLNGIFIDDSGNPGIKSPSLFLPESRKSWCAVVIPSKMSDQVGEAMSILSNSVKVEFKAEELHFTDIYNRRGLWKSVSINKRMELFEIMGTLCASFLLPVFYQSSSKEFMNDHPDFLESLKNEKIDFWNLQRIDHYSLFFLLCNVKEGIEELRNSSEYFNECFQVYVDEGIAKAGNSIPLHCKDDGVLEKNMEIVSSKNNLGIQIADFLAFIINRSQWILMHKKSGIKFSEPDKFILSIATKLNHWTLDFVSFDELTFSKTEIESYMIEGRIKKGLPPVPQ